MNIYSEEKNLILSEIEDFNIKDILECGQCFHFTKLDELEYELLAYGRYLHIKQEKDNVILYDTSVKDYEDIWKKYFDIDRDYKHIKSILIGKDERLKSAVEDNEGIRIIKQDFFETLISFIISQNKQIPHIKQIVHMMSEKYGKKIETANGVKYCFPTCEELSKVSEDELRECKVGFRAPYIADAVRLVNEGVITESELSKEKYLDLVNKNEIQESYVSYVKNKLMTIKGVGEKVASCVMLFGLSIGEVFPVDVWMKRIMEEMYFKKDTKKEIIEKFGMEKFGEYAGFAQQYLFCYGRTKGFL